MKMGFGNGLGFAFDKGVSLHELCSPMPYGAFVLELADETVQAAVPLGVDTQQPALTFGNETVELVRAAAHVRRPKLAPIYPEQA